MKSIRLREVRLWKYSRSREMSFVLLWEMEETGLWRGIRISPVHTYLGKFHVKDVFSIIPDILEIMRNFIILIGNLLNKIALQITEKKMENSLIKSAVYLRIWGSLLLYSRYQKKNLILFPYSV